MSGSIGSHFRRQAVLLMLLAVLLFLSACAPDGQADASAPATLTPSAAIAEAAYRSETGYDGPLEIDLYKVVVSPPEQPMTADEIRAQLTLTRAGLNSDLSAYSSVELAVLARADGLRGLVVVLDGKRAVVSWDG